MDLTPGQRKAVFALVVVALLALGAFLITSRGSGAPAARTTAGHRAPVSPAAPNGRPASPAAALPSPAASPAGRGVDIYRLLPFSQSGLDRAVGVAQKFAAQYGTFSYQESTARYVASMRGLITPGLAATLARGYTTPGVAQMRTRQRQVSVGQGTVTALRAFGTTSLTFLVTLVQGITESHGHSQLTGHYAITVTKGAGGWQVSDIQLASAGNS